MPKASLDIGGKTLEIPDDVLTFSTYPATDYEYGWFDVIEQLGAMQFQMRHDMGRPYFPDTPENLESLATVDRSMLFYGGIVIAKAFNLILPADCPMGAQSYKPGEEIPESTRSMWKALDHTEEVPAVLPAPPEGKRYWWQWYRKMQAFDEIIQTLRKKGESVDTKMLYAEFDAAWDQVTETLRTDQDVNDPSPVPQNAN